MKLKTLRIQNFRSFEDETISFDDYTCFVGPNGSGKSTVLAALNLFFRETRAAATNLVSPGEEDFYRKETDREIEITLTFGDLSAEAQNDFKHYYRQGEVVFAAKAKWDSEASSAAVKQHGKRRVMPAFKPYFEEGKRKGSKVDDLKPIYAGIRQSFPDLPDATTGTKMRDALRSYEESHPELCQLEESEDELYGVSKGANLLQKHIQRD